MVELVYTWRLGRHAFGIGGSNPSSGTRDRVGLTVSYLRVLEIVPPVREKVTKARQEREANPKQSVRWFLTHQQMGKYWLSLKGKQ